MPNIGDLGAVDETVADGDLLAMHNVSKGAGFKDQGLSITKLRADAFLGRANIWTAAQTITSPAAGTVPVTVDGAASQTAALQQWRNSAGTVLASVSSTGLFTGLFAAVNAESGAGTPGIGNTFDSTLVIPASTMWLVTVAKTGGIDSAQGIGLYLVHRQGTGTNVVTVTALTDVAVTCATGTAYKVRFQNTGSLNWTYRYSLTRVF